MIRPTNPTLDDDQLTYTFDDRHWRVRGLEKQRPRRAFLEQAAAELTFRTDQTRYRRDHAK